MKPDQGWYALNTDSCVNHAEDRVGCEGVIRDDEGNWLTGFSTNHGTCLVDEVEAWTILKDLCIAWEKRL